MIPSLGRGCNVATTKTPRKKPLAAAQVAIAKANRELLGPPPRMWAGPVPSNDPSALDNELHKATIAWLVKRINLDAALTDAEQALEAAVFSEAQSAKASNERGASKLLTAQQEIYWKLKKEWLKDRSSMHGFATWAIPKIKRESDPQIEFKDAKQLNNWIKRHDSN